MKNTPNKKNNHLLNTGILIFIIIVLGIFVFTISKNKTEAPSASIVVDEENPGLLSDLIKITSPTNGGVVSTNSISLSGEARGSWYFEGSAPVEIRDMNNNILKNTYVTAQGEWMTTEFVPFTGSASFVLPVGVTEGFVVFKNNNASGEPDFDKEVVVPVKFQ